MSEPICKCPFCNNDMFAVGDTDWGFTWIHDTPKSDCPLFTTMPNSVIFPSEKAIINAFSSRPIEDALRVEIERIESCFLEFETITDKGLYARVSDIVKVLDNVRTENKRLRERIRSLEHDHNVMKDALEALLESPYSIDEASIPKAGIDANPSQVVGVMSVSIVKIRNARTALSSLLVKDGE